MLKSCIVAAALVSIATPAWAISALPVSEHGEHKKMKKEPKQEEAEDHHKKKEHNEEKKD